MTGGVPERIVRAVSIIVPEDVRRDWLREWHAELAWSRGDGGGTAALSLRALGAWPHACWLRWDRWRGEMLRHDMSYAVRTLVRQPAFTLIAVLSLGLGIGANTAMFSVVHAVLLRPLPFPEPNALVAVWTATPDRPGRGFESTAPDFVDWRRETKGFAEMAAFVASASALTGDGPAEQVPSAQVTGGFFTVLGVPALYGRTLAADDDPIGTPDVAVLGYGLWRRRFGADPSIVGRVIAIEGRPFQVVGVMPEQFRYPLKAELWIPQRFTADDLSTQRGAHYLEVIARLGPGVSLDRAREALVGTAAQLAERYPRTNTGRTVNVQPLRDSLVGEVRRPLLVMLGAVGFVLLIVCVNVANLCLTRALGRQRELALRTALGASRFRLVRALLVESMVLAAAGALAGVLLAIWATAIIGTFGERTGIALLDQARIDRPVLAFAAGVAIVAAMLFGTLPAWQVSSRVDVSRRLREDGANTTVTRQRRRLGAALIIAESALAVVLLVGAGLLMRSFLALASVELGFSTERVQTFNVSLPDSRYQTPTARAEFVRALTSRIEGWPQVEAVGAIMGLPLTNFRFMFTMSTLDGRKLDDEEQEQRALQLRVVTPGYFRALAVPMRHGRGFEATDRLGAATAVVINETAARRLWPDESPLGHRFTLGTRLGQEGEPVGGTVVGVVADVRDFGPATAVRPTAYVAHAQFPASFLSIAVKARSDPAALVAPLGQLMAQLDPGLPMFRVRTMEQLASDAVAQPRLYLMLLSVFAAFSVLLAAIGIYGVLAHVVSQRTREIGLRLALGAARGRVLRMVVGQALALAAAGLALGLAGAVGLSGLLRGLLFGVEPADLPTYLTAGVGLAAVALVASVVPAVRAARVDPIAALRSE
jgi:putative ABC transport system permease protein